MLKLSARRRAKAVQGAAAAKHPRIAPGLQSHEGADLIGHYDDQQIYDEAASDGKAGVFTAIFGAHNRAPRVIKANNWAAWVAVRLIRHRLHSELTKLDTEIERTRETTKVAKAELRNKAAIASETGTRHRNLEARIYDEGLSPPEEKRRHLFQEFALLVPLGLGDLVFISLTYQVLGMDDKPVAPFIPLSELQMAATTSVAALLIAARVLGHRLVRFMHLLGTLVRPEADRSKDPYQRTRLTGAFDSGAQSLVALAGVSAILLGINGIRVAYLEGAGIDAHGSSFLLVQTGIAVAGVLIAAWFAHPFDKQFRSSAACNETAGRVLNQYKGQVEHLVSSHNGCLVKRDHVIEQHREWVKAKLADTSRQNERYAAWLLREQLEPTEEQLLPDELPQADDAPWNLGTPASLDDYFDRLLAATPARLDLDDVAELLEPSSAPEVGESPAQDPDEPDTGPAGEDPEPAEKTLHLAELVPSPDATSNGGANGHHSY